MIRNTEDLHANALKFWPERIAELERNSSIIPKLIETQDKFISLLNIADAEPFAWKRVFHLQFRTQFNHKLKLVA